MWGCISTESLYHSSFNTGFSLYKSDIILALAQWQYWWWFWFAFLWSFYYLLMIRVVRFRTLKMKPKIVTSFRPHGRWGDFLAAIIPSLWCLNILVGSNYILRMIEWQNESSLFLVRIRARQWYWVYKFETRNLIDMLSVPKNLGKNKWFFSNFGDIQYSESYFNILRIRAKTVKTFDYWETYFEQMGDSHKDMHENLTENFLDLHIEPSIESYYEDEKAYFSKFFILEFLQHKKKINLLTEVNNNANSLLYVSKKTQKSVVLHNSVLTNSRINFKYSKLIFENIERSVLFSNHTNLDVQTRFFRRSFGTNVPFRFMKTPLTCLANLHVENQNDNYALFKARFNDGTSHFYPKPIVEIFLYTIRQERYKRRISIPVTTKYSINPNTKKKELIFKGRTMLLNNSVFSEYLKDIDNVYKLNQKNRSKSEKFTVSLSKRLLRTRRTLVLPAKTNITLITNSFDVIHSWFVPGLGLKLDCVPGRSTHHSLYISRVGFYYGQCAEVCGRYHHHMPIRLCALPFEHFLIWWNHYGLHKIIKSNKKRNFLNSYGFKKYSW